MKIRRKLGVAIAIALLTGMAIASPPAFALERDVGGVVAITEVQMGANPATLTLEGLAPNAIAGDVAITVVPMAIPEVATIMTYSSAALEKIDATWTTTVNISAQGALVHSPALGPDLGRDE